MTFSDIYQFLAKGGPIMVPIALFSVVALAVFLERISFLRKKTLVPHRFMETILTLAQESRIAEAITLAQSNDSPCGRIAEAGLRYTGRPRTIIHQVLEEAGQNECSYLERYTGILSAAATVAPLLGLLGTVTGMIAVFQTVVIHGAQGGNVDAALLAGGIWEAMLTTAAGLTVAIPSYLAYRYLLSRVDAILGDLAQFGGDLLELICPEEERPQTVRTVSVALESGEILGQGSRTSAGAVTISEDPSKTPNRRSNHTRKDRPHADDHDTDNGQHASKKTKLTRASSTANLESTASNSTEDLDLEEEP